MIKLTSGTIILTLFGVILALLFLISKYSADIAVLKHGSKQTEEHVKAIAVLQEKVGWLESEVLTLRDNKI